MKKIFPVVLCLTTILTFSGAWAEELSIRQLSRELDRLFRSESSRGTVEMIVTNPHFTRRVKMKMWTKGLEMTLIRIVSPRKEKGMATLRRNNEMWNFLPKIGKTIRIPPSMMMGSWMGSDLTNDDVVKETTWEQDYTVELMSGLPENRIGLVYRPKPDAPVTWQKIVVIFDKPSRLPLSQEFYDEKGIKARVMEFSEVRDFGGRRIPAKFVIRPLTKDKAGRLTEFIYHKIEFDVEIPDSYFSLSRLRRR